MSICTLVNVCKGVNRPICNRRKSLWLNVSICGLFCGLLTLFFVGYGVYVTNLYVIDPWLGLTSFWGFLVGLIYDSLALLAIISHLKTMTTNPGTVPFNAYSIAALDVSVTQKDSTVRKCKKCDSFKPKRAHHCKECDRCIVKMDHHCPWVNNCVGIGNQKLFILFLLYTFFLCTASLILVILKYTVCSRSSCTNSSATMNYDGPVMEHVHVVFLIVEAILFGCFTLFMLSEQYSAIESGVTTLELIIKKKGGHVDIENASNSLDVTSTDFDEIFGHFNDIYPSNSIWHYLAYAYHIMAPIEMQYPNTMVRDVICGYSCGDCDIIDDETDVLKNFKV